MTKFLKSGNSTLHESLARPHARWRCPPSAGRGESRPVCRRPGWSQQASAWQTARCQDPWQIAGPDGHETRSCRQGPRQRRWCHSASQRYSQTPHVILSTSSLLPCWGRGRTRSGHGARGGDGQHDEGAPETSRRIHAQRPACRCGPTGVRNDQVGPTSVCDVRGQTPRKNATRSSSREQRQQRSCASEIQVFKRCVVAASTGEPARLPPFPPTPRDQCAVHACRKFQLAAWARAHFARKGAHCGWHRAHQAHVGRGLGGQLTCGACARVSAGPAWTRRMCKTPSDSRPRHQGKRGAMEPKTLTVQPATTPLSSLARKRWLLERASIPTART